MSQDITDIIQKILSEVTETIFLKNSDEIIQNFDTTDLESTVLNVERKPSETSDTSSGFEDLCSKTISENADMIISTPKNEASKSYEELFNDTIDEAINKFEFEETLKEASVQTSPMGLDRECQCDLIIKTNERANKEAEIENTEDRSNFNLASESVNTKENIHFEEMEICERVFSFRKHPPRIRVGLSKRARLQSLPTRLII